MKAFTDMINLINKSTILLVVVLSLFSCSNDKLNTRPQGYLNSVAYKEYLYPEKADTNYQKDAIYNAMYSIKRMFRLLGEESFLYNSEYGLYAVFMCMHRGRDTIDYYILKSKDSIYTLTIKKLVNADHFLYVNKIESDVSITRPYNFEVTSKLLELKNLQLADRIFDEAIIALSQEPKYFDNDNGLLRCLYLYYKDNYYYMTDHKLPANMMQKIDSLFKLSL